MNVTANDTLRIIRAVHNISQRNLATQSNVSQFTISAFESKRRNLTPETRQRIEDALGTALDNPAIINALAALEQALGNPNAQPS